MRVETVSSPDDPRLAVYRDVRDADLRERDGLFLAEGRLNVKRLITVSRYRTHSVLVTETGLVGIRPALERLDATTPVYVASRELLFDVVGYAMHRGCLAAGERGQEPALASLVGAAPDASRTLVVLEDVTDAENVGGLFRNALAFGADGVVLTRRCVDPLYRRAIRVSMGATLRVPHARTEDAATARAALDAAGFASIALTTDADATPLSDCASLPRRIALWLGSEGEGLSRAAQTHAEHCVRIPMAAGADSLNVATAAGIALHHFRSFASRERP
jgi:tRNA G18 (ribose-2'-O)-methylase SpoU